MSQTCALIVFKSVLDYLKTCFNVTVLFSRFNNYCGRTLEKRN